MAVDKVLVAVHGNGGGDEALHLASQMVKGTKARVYAMYVIRVKRDLPLDAEVSQETFRAEQVLHHLEELGKELKCPVEATLLQARDVGPAVIQEAMEIGVDVIVVQMPYKKRFGSFTLGDTVSYILKNAPCQVLVCREPMASNVANGPDIASSSP
ncbi:MAG: universal stress protein [Dehalococcoidia bacterium]|nr:universal stress protein [Dehalococcoidia bacterium]